MNRPVLALALALSVPVLANKPAKQPLKLPQFLSFGRGNTKLPNGGKELQIVRQYLAAHPEVTLLRVAGYHDSGVEGAQGETQGTARAMAVAAGLVKLGVDCKRLIAVGFGKGGYMDEGGAYVNFVNAELRHKAIGGAPKDGGGKVAGDVCSGKASASNDDGESGGKPAKAGKGGKASAAASEDAGGGSNSDGITKPNDPRLSAARKKLLAEAEKRIPSTQGMPAAAGKTNLFDGTPKQSKGTSCGLLPGVLLQKMGIRGLISSYATEGLRTEAQKMGVWVENDGKNLPKPGDLYWLRYDNTPETDSVAHVGVIYEVNKNDPTLGMIWITADAGQGSMTQQQALFVNRQVKKKDGTHYFLSGPKNTPGDSPNLRRIGGWIDLDKLMAKMGKG
jgi:OOP family OmpA-OmpF porin